MCRSDSSGLRCRSFARGAACGGAHPSRPIQPGSGRHVRIPPCRSSKTRPAPQTLAQRLYAENLELRELLLAVAGELERMAAFEGDAENRRTLLARAMRIRWRVHYGPGGARRG